MTTLVPSTVLAAALLVWACVDTPRAVDRGLRTTPSSVLSDRRTARGHRLRERDLEPFIDGVAVVLGAGGTVSDALRLLAERGPIALRSDLGVSVAARASGVAVGPALADLEIRLGPVFAPTLRALVAAERDGAPLGAVLQTLAAEARTSRRLAAEASARALPVRLLFPLVLCALPAVLIGAVVPLLLVVADESRWF